MGEDSSIGEDSILYSNVSIYSGTVIGKRVILHSGVVVGSDGFGYVKEGKKNVKIPQVGRVEIEDDVEIGANTTIDRATLGKTIIRRGVKIDNLVQVAHNVVIGEDSIIVAQVGISGSTKIGSNVTLAGQVGVVGPYRNWRQCHGGRPSRSDPRSACEPRIRREVLPCLTVNFSGRSPSFRNCRR